MSTATVFPVNSGEVATLTCSTGSVLSGDNAITCLEGTEFNYTDIPTCSVLGKLFNKLNMFFGKHIFQLRVGVDR